MTTEKSRLELFIYTLEEYLRFRKQLPLSTDDITSQYDESDYIAIQTRLMLLRKYTSKGKNNNVYFENLISDALTAFPDAKKRFENLNEEYCNIMQQQIEHVLSDGTKLNIYETIELTMYGLYLHADADKIMKINKTHDSIRFLCTRKFVIEIEKIVIDLYNALIELGITTNSLKENNEHAPIIYLGDSNSAEQKIRNSSFWNNLYGCDATDEELEKLVAKSTSEELLILHTCIEFLNMLKESPAPIKELKKLVHPSTTKAWGDFSEVQAMYRSICSPGFSNKIRYSDDKTLAYVRIFPNVQESFMINTPHIIADVYEVSLAKDFLGRWRVFSIGGHLDSIFEK